MTKMIVIIIAASFYCSHVSGMDEVAARLRQYPSIFVKDITGHVHEIDIRGFSATDYTVLINDRKTNFADLSGVDWNQISLHRIDRIEINKAGGSVLYGDNATAGVVNIVTRTGKDHERPTLEASTYVASYDYYTQNLAVFGSSESFDYMVSGRHKYEGGYRSNSSARSYHAGTDFGYQMSGPEVEFRTETALYIAEYELPGALTWQEMEELGRRASRTPEDKVKVTDWYVKPEIRAGGLRISLPIRRRDYRYDSAGWFSEADSVLLNPEIRYSDARSFDLFDNTFTIGIGTQYAVTRAKDPVTTARIRRNDYGAYMHDKLLYGPVELEAGVRMHHARFKFPDETGTRETRTVWNVGLACFLDEIMDIPESKIFANYGTSFRFPATDEYWSYWTGLNRDLETQTSRTLELGIETRWENISGKLTYFDITTRNELYYDPYDFINSNLDRTNRKGLELFTAVELGRLRPYGSFTRMWTDMDRTGNRIPMVPNKMITVGTDIELIGKEHVTVYGAGVQVDAFMKWNYVGERFFLNDIDNLSAPMKPYKTMDLGVKLAWRNFDMEFGINNLTNTKYADLGVRAFDVTTMDHQDFYYPNQERTIYAKVNFLF